MEFQGAYMLNIISVIIKIIYPSFGFKKFHIKYEMKVAGTRAA
jgi:hypothetical protein